MPTTTNFGWTTPADTDLVKDGAAAIRTLGNGIDTSLLDLKGGTTGQVLTKNTNTDLDFVWSAPASGGETLISTTTLSGASVTLSSIPQTYNDLKLVIRNYRGGGAGETLRVRVNADSTANRHRTLTIGSETVGAFNATSWGIQSAPTSTANSGINVLTVYDYTNTATWKLAIGFNAYSDDTTPANVAFYNRTHAYNQTGAVTSLVLFPNDGNNFGGGTVLLYGVK